MKFPNKKQKPNTYERHRPANKNPAVFSYYARGASSSSQNTGRRDENTQSASSNRRRHRLRLGHVPSYIALAAIVFAILYSCWLQPNPKVIIVSKPGTVHRNAQDYQQAIVAIWKQSLLSQTKLTIDTVGLRQDIQQQFGELANVEIELPLLGHRPTVVITPEQPAIQLISSNGSFYVDAAGKVMARTTDLTQNQLSGMPLIHDETGISAESGKSIISGLEATYLIKLFAQLQAQSISIESITLPSGAADEADVRITGQAYYVKFSTDTDPRQAVGTYLAAKAKLDGDHIMPAQYMDVRVDEKVFYK